VRSIKDINYVVLSGLWERTERTTTWSLVQDRLDSPTQTRMEHQQIWITALG